MIWNRKSSIFIENGRKKLNSNLLASPSYSKGGDFYMNTFAETEALLKSAIILS